MSKQTALDWYWDKTKSHFEHDGDLFETATFTFAIAKQKELENIYGFADWIAKDWVSVLISGKWMWMNIDNLRPDSYKHTDMYYTSEELYQIYLQEETHNE